MPGRRPRGPSSTRSPTVGDTAGLSAVASMVIAQALLGAGVAPPTTTGHRDAIGRQLDPEAAIVVAGWIRRGWLAGTSQAGARPVISRF